MVTLLLISGFIVLLLLISFKVISLPPAEMLSEFEEDDAISYPQGEFDVSLKGTEGARSPTIRDRVEEGKIS